METLLGPNIILWSSAIFGKPAKTGAEINWHQDSESLVMHPRIAPTVWIAITNVTEENGCMQVIPGTHKNQTDLPVRPIPGKYEDDPFATNELETSCYDKSKAVNVELEPGQFSIHDPFVVHGSNPNRSEYARAGFSTRYMPTSSFYDRDCERFRRNPRKYASRVDIPLFLVRGIDEYCVNDKLIGI